MKQHKILYGVCGIGNGHVYRQLPIIEDLALDNGVVIFTYGNGLEIFRSHFQNNKHVTIIEVSVPYYPGTTTGLDFNSAADLSIASGVNYISFNARAMAEVARIIGKPDLVISDYEPVCAQYAYAYGSPLITIDQQSKYLTGDFPVELAGQRYVDEVMRLRMFFPVADIRIACSFFRVDPRPNAMDVTIVPSVLRPAIRAAQQNRRLDNKKTIIVYLTSQSDGSQTIPEIMEVLSRRPDWHFTIFAPSQNGSVGITASQNVSLGQYGASNFDRPLLECRAVITTAGHGLLSEAMHLGVPVYAMPINIYEQQVNADVISKNGFGMSASKLTVAKLDKFISNLEQYAKNIRDDNMILNHGDGAVEVLTIIRDKLKCSE